MWIFLNNSFLSIVSHRTVPDMLLVRARNKGDIEAVFPSAHISKTPQADYLYRANIQRPLVTKAIVKQINNIDYDNFKSSIINDRYHDACLGVWSTMNLYQQVGEHIAKAKKD